MVYVSVRGRLWLDVEAANMVESIGDYVKHRRVVIVTKIKGAGGATEYAAVEVPAISGESVAHTYQVLLAEELTKVRENVCSLCKQGILLKSTDASIFKESRGGSATLGTEDPSDIEAKIISTCGVEDIGGFLLAEKNIPNVRRTSLFTTGYMIPVQEVIESTVITAQLHSRNAGGYQGKKEEKEKIKGQMIYRIETASTIYRFSFGLDLRDVGKYKFSTSKYGQIVSGLTQNNIKNRSIAALKALRNLLIEMPIGAKRTRFYPDARWEAIAIAVSDDVFELTSAATADFIERSIEKLHTVLKNKIDYNTKIYIYREGMEKCPEPQKSSEAPAQQPQQQQTQLCSSYKTPEGAILAAIEDAIKRVNGSQQHQPTSNVKK